MTQKFQIGGKKRGMTFGLLAIEKYCEVMGGDIEQLDKIFKSADLEQVDAVCKLVWSAMVASCELDGDDMDFSLPRVKQWVGDMPQGDFEAIMVAFKNSKYLGRTIAEYYYSPVEQEAQDSKKKSPKKH